MTTSATTLEAIECVLVGHRFDDFDDSVGPDESWWMTVAMELEALGHRTDGVGSPGACRGFIVYGAGDVVFSAQWTPGRIAIEPHTIAARNEVRAWRAGRSQ